MLDINRKITELLQSEPDPREGAGGRSDFSQTQLLMGCPPVVGVVTDNRDPECLGRVRISYGQGKGKGRGMWSLPEIGTQALAVFTATDRSQGYILGFIYDRQHRPPEHGAERASDTTLLQTKSHRIEITDKEGSEEIRIESAEGRMRVSIGKSGGIKVENELGGINIKCRNFKCEGEGEIHLATKKTLTARTDDALKIKAGGSLNITSDKAVNLKGKNIKMSGSKGVTAEGKQIAVQGDKVMGFDVHIMVVPSGNGTTTVPLPHPFIGKLADKLSKDVKIKDKACATKDSVAKHNDSMHMQLPGTIKFQNNPKKEGKVTGGTSSKVKINGKEVAVIGSQVSTCNDMGAQNNSTVIAPGASMPMPVIINPKNTEEWKREQEESEKKEPKFSSVKWGSSSVEEGKEVELTASVQDIEDGNMVTLQVFPEGKGPEDGVPIASFPLTVKGGSVSTKWSYHANKSELPPDSDPKFVFSAHCVWCNFEKSSNSVEVKLIRPEITKAEWQDKDGGSTSKGLVGETLKLHAETKDMEGGVTFRIYDDKGRQVFEKGAEIEGDKAEAEWTYHWNGEKLEEKPKFTFEVTGQRCKKVESSEVEIGQEYNMTLYNSNFKLIEAKKVKIFSDNGESYEKESDASGKIELDDLVPSQYFIQLLESKESVKNDIDDNDESVAVVKVNGSDYERKYLLPENKNIFIEINNDGIVSL
ncbi:phage baseplate assembly protein V [Treponema sp.]|uniref:phage baseplate assembly protein V n=1 Tax=Treponema sp. TaxID=166 RepID=UPI0025F61B29|nr:phage baseplate assembly protein V [Treponema sp.]